MVIDNLNYRREDVYDISVTVPDSFVVAENKTGKGHGEAKFYMGSKSHMREFYAGDKDKIGFKVTCVILKKDLLSYMQSIRHEYSHPSVKYRGEKGIKMSHLWELRRKDILELPDVLFFDITDQDQIQGDRGYVSTRKPLEGGYGLLRRISLPFVTYVSVMKLRSLETGALLFYWKLFADFTQMAEMQYAAKNYGKKQRIMRATRRDGQVKYRQQLLDVFKCCPFTQIDDTKLLVASHIKPWATCNIKEKKDPNNGFILSPLFDKLFDKGYITFTNDGKLIISDWISEENVKRIDFDKYKSELLHLSDERRLYLEYHRTHVFKN